MKRNGETVRKCRKEEISRALEYIGEDKLLCFYLYIDLLECGVEDEGVGLWVSEAGPDITAVVYQYYDCLHIFSRDGDFPLSDIVTLIYDINPKVIVSSEQNINYIKTSLGDETYTYELNHIITANMLFEESTSVEVEIATENEIPQIAEMMMRDPIYNKVYTYEKLCEDLLRRCESGFGRSFVIKDEQGKILCANATNAETDELAIIGGLIVHPDARGTGLGMAVTAGTWNRIRREGKKGLAFLLDGNEKTINLHKKMGYSFIGTSARLIRN